jgi:YesN/AraC family two-component response regulator
MAINNSVHELMQGDVAILVSGDSHMYFRTQSHERLVVMFAPEIFESSGSRTEQSVEILNRLKSTARVSSQWNDEHAARARAILNSLVKLADSDEFGRELAIRSRLIDLILMLCNETARDEQQSNAATNAIQAKVLASLEKLFIFIERNYAKDIDLKAAADVLGYVPSYFARMFKRYTNTTFMSYLSSFRISKAKEMLLNENKNVTQIAEETGFGSVKTLNRVFKLSTGISPLQYRKSNFEKK